MVEGGLRKYLITGVSGFVGGHYLEYLIAKKPDVHISGIDISSPGFDIEFYQGSLLDRDWVRALIEKLKPDCVVNLASYSSVAYSWEHPIECFTNNTNIFLNIIEAVRKAELRPRVLSVGSSEEYGIVKKKDIPLTERASLNPINPYAIARVGQEYLSKIYAQSHGIPVICTRSFNHIGPRQKDTFVVSSLAKQVVEAKNKKRSKIVAGDLGIVRDFTDVRDVVRAYDLLLEKGKAGEVYNVCSGEGHALSEILGMLQKKAGTNAKVKRSEHLVRPKDNPILIGSSKKLKKHTGFKRKYTLSHSLDDILEYWERQITP